MNFLGSLVSQLVLELVLASSPSRYLNSEIDTRRHCKAEGFGDCAQVKLVDIKDVLLMMRCVRLKVRSVTVLRCTVQVVVLFDEFHELLLYVGQFALRELIFIRPDFLLLQVAEEAKFVLIYEK